MLEIGDNEHELTVHPSLELWQIFVRDGIKKGMCRGMFDYGRGETGGATVSSINWGVVQLDEERYKIVSCSGVNEIDNWSNAWSSDMWRRDDWRQDRMYNEEVIFNIVTCEMEGDMDVYDRDGKDVGTFVGMLCYVVREGVPNSWDS